jgi:kumamolisin
MHPNKSPRPLRGSERSPVAHAQALSGADPNRPIKLTVYVRPKAAEAHVPTLDDIAHGPTRMLQSPERAKALEAFDADPKDIAAVETFATANSLEIVESSATKRSVRLEGKSGDAMAAFGVELKVWQSLAGRYRGRTGPIYVPASLDGIVEAVFGFDNRPTGRPYARRSARRFVSRAAHPHSYLPTELAHLYGFPDHTDGSGQTVGILAFNGMLGETGEMARGGYSAELIGRYFDEVLHQKSPFLSDVVVHGSGNEPGDGTDPMDATSEVLLDICMAAAVAPKARFVVYFTEFTEQGWVDAITAAVAAKEGAPSVISISYGNPEDGPLGEALWTSQAIRKVNEAFHRAALAGITICCASGDQGSSEQLSDHRQHVDFPASSPWVLGCGGTRVIAQNGVILRETVWNDGPQSAAGGGISRLFALPAYQSSAAVPPSANPGHRIGRGVPDVAGLADPETGALVVFPDGSLQAIGGTSTTAPLWAGLVARLNQALGKPVGFLNPLLYKMPPGVLRDILQGDNGAYRAAQGWDPCTGLGSPNGTRLLAALRSLLA